MTPRSRFRGRLALAGLLAVLLLAAGCGKKGPLYLPPDSPPPTAPSAPSS